MPKTFHDLQIQLKEATEDLNATKIESIIVDVVNTGVTRISDSKIGDGTVAGAIEVGRNIASYLGCGPSGGRCKASLATAGQFTPLWTKLYGPASGAATTPKTDIIVAGKRISVKKGAARLMSGSPAEAVATFYAATQDPAVRKHLDILEDKTMAAIGRAFERQKRKFKGSDQTIGGFRIKGEVGSLLKTGSNSILNWVDEFQTELTGLFDEAFSNNPSLKVSFVKEAMSGMHKFGKDSLACAEWVLATTGIGQDPVLHQIDNSYVTKIAGKCNISSTFKTNSVKSKTAEANLRKATTVMSVGIDSSEDSKKIANELLRLAKGSGILNKEIKDLNKRGDTKKVNFLMGKKADDARELLRSYDAVTIGRVVANLSKSSPRLAKWIRDGQKGLLPENTTPRRLNAITEHMIGSYNQGLITEQELQEGMLDWFYSTMNSLKNNKSFAGSLGLRRTESMGLDVKALANTYGIGVAIIFNNSKIDFS